MDLVIELANDEDFINLAPVPKKGVDEREREELITRFFAYGDGLEEYKDRPSEFLFNYSKMMNERFSNDTKIAENYRELFRKTMAFVASVFPYGFKRNSKGSATPRARFEAIAIGSKLALDKFPFLEAKNVPSVDIWLTSKDFNNVIGSDGANAKSRLRERMNFVFRKLVDD